MKYKLKSFGPIYPLVVFFLIGLLILQASRLLLLVVYTAEITDFTTLLDVLAVGLRFDLIILCGFSILPALFMLLMPYKALQFGPIKYFFILFLSVVTGLILWMELYTPSYLLEYGERPARIFYEYLAYPKDIIILGLGTYPIQFFLHPFLAVLTMVIVFRYLSKQWRAITLWHWSQRLLVLPVIFFVLFLGIRSSIGHRPANISMASVTSNHLVNQIALNSSYSILHSLYRMKDEKDSANFYGRLSDEEMLQRVDRLKNTGLLPPAEKNLDGKKTQNLVIILQESLGAQFVASLDGLPLTPSIDAWGKKGLWFSKLYATGTRSVRGVEAVITGFPPTPARSVVKLELAQNGFFTLAGLLKNKGYQTEFIYGGDSHFDNMHGFLRTNGFDTMIDQKDYQNPMFEGSWGVSDEDLFEMAHARLSQQASNNKPFFTFIFTGTNHIPYEFPDGKIQLYDEEKNTRNNAVKYADFAMGQFLEKAQQSDYWKNTIFMIVADHDARVLGAESVPVPNFHIPGFFLGERIAPKVIDQVVSHIDLAPTALSLMGIEEKTPMIGKDLTRLDPDFPGSAIMQYGNNHAYMLGDQVVVHEPYEQPLFYKFDGKKLLDSQARGKEEMAKDGLALAMWPSYKYKKRLYQLDQLDSLSKKDGNTNNTNNTNNTKEDGVSK